MACLILMMMELRDDEDGEDAANDQIKSKETLFSVSIHTRKK